MMFAHRLAQQVLGIAADLVHRAAAFETVTLRPVDGQVDDRAAHIVHAETIVEQADEGADCAGRIIILRLAEQQRRTPLEIAQIDVIAQRRADRAAVRSEEHTSELQSLMRSSSAVFCLKKKKT